LNPSPGWDVATSVASDEKGACYVSGYDLETGDFRWRAVKLDAAGKVEWDWIQDAGAAPGIAYGIVRRTDGNISVVGYDTAAGGGKRRIVSLSAAGQKSSEWTEDPSPGLDVIYDAAEGPLGELATAGYDSGPGDREWRLQLFTDLPSVPELRAYLASGVAAAAAVFVFISRLPPAVRWAAAGVRRPMKGRRTP
jgi:hypothetical protein